MPPTRSSRDAWEAERWPSANSRSGVTGCVARASVRTNAVRPDVQPVDLLRLSHAVAVAAERAGDGAGQAERLLSLMLNGVLTDPADDSRTEY